MLSRFVKASHAPFWYKCLQNSSCLQMYYCKLVFHRLRKWADLNMTKSMFFNTYSLTKSLKEYHFILQRLLPMTIFFLYKANLFPWYFYQGGAGHSDVKVLETPALQDIKSRWDFRSQSITFFKHLILNLSLWNLTTVELQGDPSLDTQLHGLLFNRFTCILSKLCFTEVRMVQGHSRVQPKFLHWE